MDPGISHDVIKIAKSYEGYMSGISSWMSVRQRGLIRRPQHPSAVDGSFTRW